MWRHEKCALAGMVSVAIIACFAGVLWGQGSVKQVACSGMVVDWRGRPVAGAEVVGCELLYDYAAGRTSWAAPSRTTTGQDGRFQLQVSAERKNYIWVVAFKEGLALAWQGVRFTDSSQDMAVRLGEPAVLAGTVVDEAGNGVSGATVRLCLKMGWMGGAPGVPFGTAQAWVTACAGEEGQFRFDRLPAGATADFWVEAPGKASCWTYWEHDLSDIAGTRFRVGRTDIRIVLTPEGILRGRVVDEDSGQGVAGVRLLARPNTKYANYSCVAPVTSGLDGSFACAGLAANDYSLQIVGPYGQQADWVGKDVKVTVAAGRTAEVNVPVGKGGLVEVTILDATTDKPIENAIANVSQPASFGLHPCWYHSVRTNADGLARLRVPPGECRLAMWADAYNYFADPDPLIIAKGESVQRQVSLVAFPAVTGTVRGPDGRPAAGVIVASKPVCEGGAPTDEEGRFKVTWRQSSSIQVVLVLARDPKRNLAGLARVKDQEQPVDVTLSPAFVVRGRITDPNGKGIPTATVSLKASMPRWITSVAPAVLTDANGFYEARAIAAPTEEFRYRLEVNAEGFGPVEHGKLPFEAAQEGQVEVSPIVLTPADKSISGVVVDANGIPVAGVPIFVAGPNGSRTSGQPRHQTSSDEQGRFTVEGVCAGPLRIQAAFGSISGGAGFLDAEGGDHDVEVVLGRSGVHSKVKPLLDRPLPEWKELIDLKPERTRGKAILICFFDFQQRPSRHCITQLAKQADQLKQKGITVIAVQASKVDQSELNEWVKKNNIPFPVGMVQGDEEKTRFAWGVKALPWLILANKEHVVTAEGFGLNQLDDKIKETGEK